MALLSVKNLRTYFHTRHGTVKAVDGISFDLAKNETLGIVGESGSGKSVSCYSLLGLIPTPPGKIEEGEARYEGYDLLHSSQDKLREVRGDRITMIFQDPMTCLNPYMTIGAQIMEPLLIHENLSKAEATKRTLEMLGHVGITDAKQRMKAYPHEFSGGMRQRAMIAMALITKPDLLIADEPTTALDVTVQAQILDLIKQMQREIGMAVIFITHDLGVIASFTDRVLVMYAGRIVEQGETADIFYRPKHPYTQALLASIPSTQKKGEKLFSIPGMPPDTSNEIVGCAFAPRCDRAASECSEVLPPYVEITDKHKAACLRIDEVVA